MQKRKKRRSRKQRNLITLCLCLSLFLILLIPYCIACSSLDDPAIWGQVTVNGISVGGSTKKEAALALHSQFARDFHDSALTIALGGKEYHVNIFSALGFKTTDTISAIYKPGHRLWILRGFDWLSGSLKGQQSYKIYPYIKDTAALDKAIQDSGILEFNSTVEPRWEVKDSSLIIHKGQEGAAIDMETLKQNILTALQEHKYTETIPCPAEMTPPKEADIQAIYKEVHAEARNASLDPQKDYEILPSVRGLDFDPSAAQTIYNNTAYGGQAVIPLKVTEPQITTEDMKTKLFADTLASYTTYAGGTSERISNIYKAVEACSGTILLPGESFSYNHALGERTTERGYQSAAAYSSDAVIQEVGGGICQVSSTIFAAALYTELSINERRNHSMPVSYLPLGMDAAVSWGDIDFSFTNTYKYPVKLNVYFDGGTLTAEFVGTKENDHIIDVSLETLEEYSINTYRVIYDSSWNRLSSDQITYSFYNVPEAEKEAEETEGENSTNPENTDGTENPDASGNTEGTENTDNPEDSGEADASTDTDNTEAPAGDDVVVEEPIEDSGTLEESTGEEVIEYY